MSSQLTGRFADKVERRVPSFPEHIDIELTNACNLRCVICPRLDMTRAVGPMDFKLFQQIVDEIGQYGLSSSWLHLFGEPLLHPKLIDAIRYMKAKGNVRELGISTNVVLLNREIARDLMTSGLDRIVLSVDGANKATYEALRCNSQFELVTANVEDFLATRKKLGIGKPQVWLQIIEMRETAAEVEEFAQRWKPLLQDEDLLLLKAFETFAGQTEDRGLEPAFSGSTLCERVPCDFLWRNLAIFCDGRVTACCFDVNGRLTLGDLSETSLREIWQGRQLGEMRRMHEQTAFDQLPLCQNCSRTKEMVPDAKHNAENWPGTTEQLAVEDASAAGLFGAGWYAVDGTVPPTRWTKRKATVYLKPASEAKSIEVTCSSSFPDIATRPAKVRFLVDETECADFAIADNGWHTLVCHLPAGSRGRVVKLSLAIDETWCPHKIMGTGDMRELGIAVREISIV